MSEKFETCELCQSEIRLVGDFRTTQCACLRCSMDVRERLRAVLKFATPSNRALVERGRVTEKGGVK